MWPSHEIRCALRQPGWIFVGLEWKEGSGILKQLTDLRSLRVQPTLNDTVPYVTVFKHVFIFFLMFVSVSLCLAVRLLIAFDLWQDEMEYRDISYVPALYKIFDEILVNAADNLQRDPKMKVIKVDIDKSKGQLSSRSCCHWQITGCLDVSYGVKEFSDFVFRWFQGMEHSEHRLPFISLYHISSLSLSPTAQHIFPVCLFLKPRPLPLSQLWHALPKGSMLHFFRNVPPCASWTHQEESEFGMMVKAFRYSCLALKANLTVLYMQQSATCVPVEAQEIQSLCSRTGLWPFIDEWQLWWFRATLGCKWLTFFQRKEAVLSNLNITQVYPGCPLFLMAFKCQQIQHYGIPFGFLMSYHKSTRVLGQI